MLLKNILDNLLCDVGACKYNIPRLGYLLIVLIGIQCIQMKSRCTIRIHINTNRIPEFNLTGFRSREPDNCLPALIFSI